MAWYQQTHWRILIALGLGLVYGAIAAVSGWGEFTADWITPFGTIFLRLLLLIAVPLVLASLITGIASLSNLQKLSRIGGKTIVIYVGTTLMALIIGLVTVNLIDPGETVPEALRQRLQETLSGGCRGTRSGCHQRPGTWPRSSRSSMSCPRTSWAPPLITATC